MKKLLIYLVLFTSVCLANEKLQKSEVQIIKDSPALIQTDSSLINPVDISKIVKRQVEAAMTGTIKSSINPQVHKETKKPEIKKQETQAQSKLPENVFYVLSDFNKKYMNILIFVSVSACIILFVIVKRYFTKTKKNKHGLKNNIEIIRTEKPVSIRNKKLKLIRMKLSGSAVLNDMSEKSISEKAKEMKVGKGELMLAAKLKAFQLTKIFK